MSVDSPPANSIPSLLRELRDETTTLLQQEVALAKTEMKANVSRLGGHAARIAIGGFVAYAGLIVLLIGMGTLLGAFLTRAGMNEQVARWLAPSLVGIIVAAVGWMMLSKAKRALAHDSFAPKQTIESLREGKQWAQDKLPDTP